MCVSMTPCSERQVSDNRDSTTCMGRGANGKKPMGNTSFNIPEIKVLKGHVCVRGNKKVYLHILELSFLRKFKTLPSCEENFIKQH